MKWKLILLHGLIPSPRTKNSIYWQQIGTNTIDDNIVKDVRTLFRLKQ